MEHVHDCPTEGCNGYFECSLDGCTGEQDRPCYVCMERERDEALNRFEVLQEISDQMAHSAGLSARRMEQAQKARAEALKERNEARAKHEEALDMCQRYMGHLHKAEKERDEARAEVERLKADLAWVVGDPACSRKSNDPQDRPCNICFKCVTWQRDEARSEVAQLRKDLDGVVKEREGNDRARRLMQTERTNDDARPRLRDL